MNTFEYVGSRFSTGQEQEEQIALWKERRNRLVEQLGGLGTLVKKEIISEHDQDIPPHMFTRLGTHDFIFPPQQVSFTLVKMDDIDTTPGYELLHVMHESEAIDDTRVKGHIRVEYSDSDSHIAFRIVDLLEGGSQLPDEAMQAFASASLTVV